jgi:hypothetical protein
MHSLSRLTSGVFATLGLIAAGVTFAWPTMADDGGFVDARPLFQTSRSDPGVLMPGVPWPLLRTPTGTPYSLERNAKNGAIWRFETRSGDRELYDDEGVIKQGNVGTVHDELQAAHAYTTDGEGTFPLGTDLWQAWSFKIAPGPQSQAYWCILGQWHATEDSSRTAPERADHPDDALSPPLAIDIKAGDILTVTSRTDADPQQSVKRYPLERFEYRAAEPIVRGVWHAIVVHVRFGYADDGLLDVWLDGKQIVQREDHYSIGFNDHLGPHFNWGIYRGLRRQGDVKDVDPNPFVVEYANMEISQSPLSDRIAHPLPIGAEKSSR